MKPVFRSRDELGRSDGWIGCDVSFGE